jgi:membrane protein
VSAGGVAPPSSQSGPERDPPVLGWRGRLEGLQRSLMRHPLMATVMDVMRVYGRGGGGMLAGALAYFAFFTLVPALLLFVGLLGVLVEDADLREQLVSGVIEQIEPIADLATFLTTELADSGRISTIAGIVGLLWGASGFYGALQGAMQRMFPGPGERDFLRTRLRGVVTVVFILGSMLAAVIIVFVLPTITDWVQNACIALNTFDNALVDEVCSIDFVEISGAVTVVAAMGVAFLAALVVYIAIPPDGPSFRIAFWPAVVAGVAIGLFTSLFGWVAPLLVRHWSTLGLVGSVFIALIWFNLVFQALVYGAAFARVRRDRDRAKAGPPRL